MRHGTNRWRHDPVLAPDQFGVAKPLGPEDIDRWVTRHGIYVAFPAPMGGLLTEYVRLQMGRLHRSRSVSSSTEALDSENARYITSRIAQHAWSLATSTRSLPTDSPGPHFQPILHEREQTPEGMLGDMDLPVGPLYAGILPSSIQGTQGPTRWAISDIITYLPPSGPEYSQRGIDQMPPMMPLPYYATPFPIWEICKTSHTSSGYNFSTWQRVDYKHFFCNGFIKCDPILCY